MKKSTADLITVIVFALFIGGFAVANIFYNPGDFSENENRYLASAPKLTTDSLFNGNYCEKAEEYINDRFPLRDVFSAINSEARYISGRRDIGGAYIGSDGYLFTKCTAEDIEQKTVDKNIKALNRFFEKNGTENIFMLVPSSSLVCSDKLPRYAPEYNQNELIDKVLAGISNCAIADVRSALKDSGEQTYYRTDHHWTTEGAFIAYTQMMRTLGIEPMTEDDFEIKTVTEDFKGTLYSKVLLPFSAKDEIKLFLPKNGETVTVEKDGESTDTLYDMTAIERKDKYQVFFGGNYGVIRISTTCENGKNLLVIKDSFANSFVPFLTAHYENIYMIDLRYCTENMYDFIKQNSITNTLVLYNTANFISDGTLRRLGLN